MKPAIILEKRKNPNPKVSLIVCTRNRASSIQRFLTALDLESLHAIEGEFILVDNGSQDSTSVVLHEFTKGLAAEIAILNEPRTGLSRARNTALNHARGDIIIFTDDDCYLGDNYFKVAATLFDNSSFEYCGGRILLYDTSDAPYGLSLQEHFETIPPGSFIPPGKFQGANLVIHRKIYKKIGGFDEQLGAGTPFRCEDIDYIARASFAGFTGAHVPELTVFHHHGRKEGNDIENLKLKNAYARGAYYMKFIKLRHFSYLWGWLRRSIIRRKSLLRTLPEFVHESHGAIDYLRMQHKLNM